MKYLKWSEVVELKVKLFQVYEVGQARYLGKFQSKKS